MISCSKKLLINCVNADPGGCICIIYSKDSKYDTYWLLAKTHDPENRLQKLNEIHRRLSHWNWHTDSYHICCQIPSLSPGLSYDQQSYQWFTGELNGFMNTYLAYSAGQSPEATHSVVKWPLSDRFISDPDCIFCHSDGCKKVKKAHYWTIKSPSKLGFGGREIVINIAETKNKIMISFYGSRDGTFVIVKPSSFLIGI